MEEFSVEPDSIAKRDFYNKLESLVKIVKEKLKTTLEQKDKEKIMKYITFIIISFQVDNIYSSAVKKSGLISVLKIFGFSEERAEKIKKLCNNGVSVALLALLIFKNLKK